MKVGYIFSDGKQNIIFNDYKDIIMFLKTKKLPENNIKDLLKKHKTNINGFSLKINYFIEMEKDKDYNYVIDDDKMLTHT